MNLQNFAADCRRWGLARALFMRLMSRLDRHAGFHLYRVHARPLSRAHPPMTIDRRFSLRWCLPLDLYDAARDPELDLTPDFVRDAQGRGDRAFAAFDGDAVVAYTWCASTTVAPHLDGLWVKVEAPCAYGYKTFTRASCRGMGLAGAVSLFSDRHGLERGRTAVVSFVEISNFSSLSMKRAIGYRAIGYAGYVKWFGRILPFRTRGARSVGFEFFVATGKKPLPYFGESEVPDQPVD